MCLVMMMTMMAMMMMIDDGDDNNEGEISARQQISRKFQLPTNFGEVLTDGQTLYQLLTRPENITIRDDHGRRFQDHMT